MKLFNPDQRKRSHKHKRVYARYELAYTFVDFGAAVSFVIGSVMFFFESWQTAGTWLFLIGSLLFAAKPTIRVARELHYLRIGDRKDLAERYEE
ncbi:YrhK family protein [Tropicimonas sp. IMCC34011]|uniref:YrhK family protein n=1 Tax=Tropicimonas sp. IMCC34011 TaxID=2248759 RepID=UPI000E257101|nr:YrhK family protein [Tropicimonas sp. IMCC34011]